MPSFLWPRGLQGEQLHQHSPRLASPQDTALLGATGSLPKSQLSVALGEVPAGLLGSSYLSVPCWTDFSASVLLVNSLLTWLKGSLCSLV